MPGDRLDGYWRVTNMAEREMAEHEVADIGALSDFCTPWCIHVVATLRIAEHVAAGVTDIDGLSVAAGCDAEVLHCVLRHLVGKGVVEGPAPGRFALNPAARGVLDPRRRLGPGLEGLRRRSGPARGP